MRSAKELLSAMKSAIDEGFSVIFACAFSLHADDDDMVIYFDPSPENDRRALRSLEKLLNDGAQFYGLKAVKPMEGGGEWLAQTLFSEYQGDAVATQVFESQNESVKSWLRTQGVEPLSIQ